MFKRVEIESILVSFFWDEQTYAKIFRFCFPKQKNSSDFISLVLSHVTGYTQFDRL